MLKLQGSQALFQSMLARENTVVVAGLAMRNRWGESNIFLLVPTGLSCPHIPGDTLAGAR